MYVLMGFIVLLSTISPNTGSSSEFDEYRLLYLLEVGVGATQFGISRTIFSMGAGDTVESIVEFEMEGEWTRIAKTWSEEESSDIGLETGLFD